VYKQTRRKDVISRSRVYPQKDKQSSKERWDERTCVSDVVFGWLWRTGRKNPGPV
jgi:hypothetical protein